MKSKCLGLLGILLAISISIFGCGGGGGGGGSTPPTPPPPPANLSATAGNSIIGLTWTAVSGATSYNVYRGTASGALGTKTKIKTGLTGVACNDSTVTNGTAYYYQVTAANATGESVGSNEANATPQANLPPVAPTGVSAVAGPAQVTIQWNDVPGASSYNIYWSTTPGVTTSSPNIIMGASTPYHHLGRTNGTTYYYIVTAVNANGESGPSFEVSATPSTAPYIAALVLTWTGTPPSGVPILQARVCTDGTCSSPINNATVTINGTALAYNASNQDYEASGPMPSAGAAVSLSVTIPSGWPVTAGIYTASGTQYATFPSITSPTSSTTWNPAVSNTVTWTAGSPTAASEYVVGIYDGSGNFYPNFSPVEVPTTSTSYTLPGGSITTPGTYSVFVGIATSGIIGGTSGGISIPNATPGSRLWIGGVGPTVSFQVSQPAPAPHITAFVATWTGAPPFGGPVLQVRVCTDNTCSSPIDNATVTISGTALAYNASNQDYEASGPMPAAGAAVDLSVTVPIGWPVTAGTYTASGTQYATFPTIISPTSSTTWNPAISNPVTWTAGSPTAASEYVVGIYDGSGNFYPNFSPVEVPATATSYTLLGGSITTAGTYSVFVGIATSGIINQTSGGISIPNAAPGSRLWIVGVGPTVSFEVTAPAPAPYIAAMALTWATAPPSGFPILQVRVCTDNTCSSPINNATVTISGTALAYNATNQDYEASGPMPAAGAAVDLSVTVPSGWPVTAGTYTASGTQYATFPSITSPTSSTTWNPFVSNTVTWTAGSPTTASEYVVGIFDGLGNFYPNGNPVEVPPTSTSYTLPANSITTTGAYSVFVGIATGGIISQTSGGIGIPNAAPGSRLWIGGVGPIVSFSVM